MIKLVDKHSKDVLMFPKNINCIEQTSHNFRLKSESTNKTFEVVFEDIGEYSDYFVFNYNREFKDLEDGEYNYYIDGCDNFGILVIGEYYKHIHLDPINTPEYAVKDDEQKYKYYE